jgi:hypothetical protein
VATTSLSTISSNDLGIGTFQPQRWVESRILTILASSSCGFSALTDATRMREKLRAFEGKEGISNRLDRLGAFDATKRLRTRPTPDGARPPRLAGMRWRKPSRADWTSACDPSLGEAAPHSGRQVATLAASSC